MRHQLLKHLLAWLFIGFTATPLAWADEAPTGEPQERVVFKRAAVASFLEGRRRPAVDEAMDETMSCPIGEICLADPSISSHAGITLTRLVDQELRGRFGKQIVPLEQVKNAEMEIKLNLKKDTPRTLAETLGNLLKVDVVIIGTVWRYRDRGEMLGVPDSKASVAFAVYAIDVKDGRKLWRGLYDATQQAVTKDLLQAGKQIRMGLKWLSADELAAHGVKEVFKAFPSNLLPGDYSGTLQQPQ